MLKFSFQTLLTLMSLVGIATYTLTSPSLTAAVVILISTVSYLLGIVVFGIRKRLIFLIALGCLCGCYLGFADGRIWRISPWHLPVERLLNQYPVSQEYFEDSPIRSSSLLKWAFLTCVEEYRKANNMTFSVEVPTVIPASTLILGNGQTIELPSMVISPAPNTVTLVDSNGVRIRVEERYSPKNKPFFILGHCWFVIFVLWIAFLGFANKIGTNQVSGQKKFARDVVDF